MSRQAVHKKHARRADLSHPVRPRALIRGDIRDVRTIHRQGQEGRGPGQEQGHRARRRRDPPGAHALRAGRHGRRGRQGADRAWAWTPRPSSGNSAARRLRRGPLGGAASEDAEALAAIGIDLDEIKRRIEDSFGPGALERVPLTPKGPLNWTGRLPLNDQAKLTLALSLKEARALHHNYIGTEHLLLGLLRVAERHPRGEFAAATLPDLGLDPATARGRVLAEVNLILRGDPPGR